MPTTRLLLHGLDVQAKAAEMQSQSRNEKQMSLFNSGEES